MNREGYAKTRLRPILGYYCRKFHVEREKKTQKLSVSRARM